MSVNLYDVLGVDASASRDEIRTAWKDLTAELDPTDRRFRALNDAAAVLLDPDKRAAYDGELAAAESESEAVEETAPVVEPEPVSTSSTTKVEVSTGSTSKAEVSTGSTSKAEVSKAVVVAAAIGALVAVAALVVTWFATAPESEGGSGGVSSAADPATREIIDAVTEMTPAVLGYDYRTLDEDIELARGHMTEEKGDEYEQLLVTNREAIEQQELVVSAVANNVGVTSISEDGSGAMALIFVDQESRQGDAQPRILEMWAALRLVNDGDEWLVDEICTERDCGETAGE